MEQLNVNRLMEALSDILSDKHGVLVTLRATRKEEAQEPHEEERASA